MKHFQVVVFLTCTGSLNSSSDNQCGCTVEPIPMLKHSIACLTHTCLQYCVCILCADTEGTAYPAFNAREQTAQQKTAE